jgi:cell division topological specificity factor
MNLFRLFGRRSSAPVARERLRILLKHERGSIGTRSELITLLRKDVLGAVARHVAVNPEHVHIKFHRTGNSVAVQIEVEIVTRSAGAARRAAGEFPTIADAGRALHAQ